MVELLPSIISILARRTIPVAEAYCSRQPFLPQLQDASSFGLTQIWPISPAAPLEPAIILPHMITPPPTPVPRVTMVRLSCPLPPPCHFSPRAAALASLATIALSPVSFSISPFTSVLPQCIFTHCETKPSSVTGPGTSIPIPSQSSFG